MVSGSTVIVGAGTFVESVLANVADLSLQGAKAGVGALDTSRTDSDDSDESIVEAPDGKNAFSVSANNVSIDGFLATSENPNGGVYGIAETTTVTGTAIVNNRVDGFAGVGIAFAAGSSGGLAQFNLVENVYAGIYLSTAASDIDVLQN